MSTKLKFKRIYAGYYKAVYKGNIVEVIRTDYDDNTYAWYYQINGSDVHDHYNYKSSAVYAAKETLNELTGCSIRTTEIFKH